MFFFWFQNEKLMLKFDEIPWYRMSKRNKRIFVQILNHLQNGVNLRMGPFNELNFETFLNVESDF